MLNDRFYKIFKREPIIGMLHLGGNNPVEQALEDLTIFEEEGIDGIIVENYHGTETDVYDTLRALSKRKTKVVIGVNILPSDFRTAFRRADLYGAFIQLDYVAGTYKEGLRDRGLAVKPYQELKERYPNIVVLGGVWPKYHHPRNPTDEQLIIDLREGMQRAEAIVVTGGRTGERTPIEKIQKFREIMGEDHPLLVGAGSKLEYVAEEARFTNGVIIGTGIKEDRDTSRKVDRYKVRDYVAAFYESRSSN